MANPKPAASAVPDAALDPLFDVPFTRFTEARNALAKNLRAMGDRATAAAVAKAKRPTRSAWALNQIARRHPQAIADFLAATVRDRDAQKRAVATRDAGGIRDAGRAMNDSIARIVALASKEIGEDGGGDLSTALARVIAGTLRAVPFASDADVARFTAGRLVTDLEAPDDFALFGAVPGDADAPAPRHPEPKAASHEPPVDAKALAKARAKEHEAAQAKVRAEAQRARVEAERRRRRLETLEKTAKDAERAATRLERAATAAAERARVARTDAEAARAEARDARDAVDRAERE